MKRSKKHRRTTKLFKDETSMNHKNQVKIQCNNKEQCLLIVVTLSMSAIQMDEKMLASKLS